MADNTINVVVLVVLNFTAMVINVFQLSVVSASPAKNYQLANYTLVDYIYTH